MADKHEELQNIDPGKMSAGDAYGEDTSHGSSSGGKRQNTNIPGYQEGADRINEMYDQYAAAQRAQLRQQYQQSRSDMEANRNKIRESYRTQRNVNAANYERNRRNFNQQAIMNGINTGASSQAALAQNNAYQGGVAQLGSAEAGDYAELDRNLADLKNKYQSDVQKAIAENDYNRAAALLDEYNQAYSRAMNEAQTRAQYGDFSGYAAIYGQSAARQMEKVWYTQNPAQAYAMGKISAQMYRKITGSWPPGYKDKNSGGGSRGGGGYRRGGGKKPGGGKQPGNPEDPGMGDPPNEGDINGGDTTPETAPPPQAPGGPGTGTGEQRARAREQARRTQRQQTAQQGRRDYYYDHPTPDYTGW